MKVRWYRGFFSTKRFEGVILDYVSVWGSVKAVVRVTKTEDKIAFPLCNLAVIDLNEIYIDENQ